MDLSILWWVLATLLVLAGLAGLFVPVLPGAVLIFGGLAVAAWAEDFAFVGWKTLTALAVLALLTYPADFLAGAFGARRYGASPRAMTGAVVGIFFGLVGVLLGPFIGAAIGEFSTQRHLGRAGRAGFGATLGLVIGVAAKLALALAMLGVFAVVRFT